MIDIHGIQELKEIVGEDSWKAGLSYYIHKGERVYSQNKLSNEEIKAVDGFKHFFLGEHVKDYDNNLILQFGIKNYYFLAKILNLEDKYVMALALYPIFCSPIIESQKQVFRNIKPVWHLKIDNK